MIFIKFTELCNHHKNPALEHFHLSIKLPHVYFHLSLDITDQLSASVDLPFLDISHG